MIEELRAGCVYRAKRWSGDTHDDLGGSVNDAGTNELMAAAADVINRLTEERALVAGERNRLQLKLDEFRQTKNSEIQHLTEELEVARYDAQVNASVVVAQKKQIDRLTAERDAALQSRDRFWDERDAAVADAERYRWLKAGGKPAVGYLELMSSSDGWDSAIDAARVETE